MIEVLRGPTWTFHSERCNRGMASFASWFVTCMYWSRDSCWLGDKLSLALVESAMANGLVVCSVASLSVLPLCPGCCEGFGNCEADRVEELGRVGPTWPYEWIGRFGYLSQSTTSSISPLSQLDW